MYEQIIHDQTLYCGTEIVEIHRKLAQLARTKDSKERRESAKQMDKRLSAISAKCTMLKYMYAAAKREDLKELVIKLFCMSLTEATTAMADPEGWSDICAVSDSSPEPVIRNIDNAIRDWRLKFLAEIKVK